MSLTVVVGPMFAGKSKELIRLVTRHTYAKRTCMVVNYDGDTRYGDAASITTHDGHSIKAMAVSKTGLASALADVNVEEVQVVGIDEVQFFDGVLEVVHDLLHRGIHVIASGLMSDFRRRPFMSVINLIANADHIEHLKAVCGCGQDAIYSKMTNACPDEDDVVQIGGAEKYTPTCRHCFPIAP